MLQEPYLDSILGLAYVICDELELFKAQLGEHLLGSLINHMFFFFFSLSFFSEKEPALKSPNPAPKRDKPAHLHTNLALEEKYKTGT